MKVMEIIRGAQTFAYDCIYIYIYPIYLHVFVCTAQLPNEDESADDDDDEGDDDDDSGTDHLNTEKSGSQLQRCERQREVNSSLPDTFQTSHLLFYERFKAYQDYMLGNDIFRLRYKIIVFILTYGIADLGPHIFARVFV